MIVRYSDRGEVVTRDLQGEELFQVIKDRTTKNGLPKEEIRVFKGMVGLSADPLEQEGGDLFPWTLSTANVDRMGDIVEQSWRIDNYKANSVVLWAHDHKIPAIGHMVDLSVGNALTGNIRFNPADIDPFANGIERRIRFKSIRAGSVGFMPGKYEAIEQKVENSNATEITGWKLSDNELWEFSICNVPANPFALSGRMAPSRENIGQKPKSEEEISPKKAFFIPFKVTDS